MAIVNLTTLKSYFTKGKTPTISNYDDLLDSTTKFTSLTDAPNSYAGQAGKKISVKSDETGVEFRTDRFTDLSDTPNSYGGQTLSAIMTDVNGTALAIGYRLEHGRYFPTLSGPLNLISYTAPEAQWLRVGDKITVSGRLDLTVDQPLLQSQIYLSLPVGASLANDYDLAGAGASWSTVLPAVVFGDTINNSAILQFNAQSSTTEYFYYHFTYVPSSF